MCDGRLLAPGAHPSLELVEAARQFFRGRDLVIEPRELWVSGLAGRKDKIAAVAPGRALAFAEDPAWGDVFAHALAAGRAAPPEVLYGPAQMLARWSTSWQAGRRGGHAVPAVRNDGYRRPSRFTRSVTVHRPSSTQGQSWPHPTRL